ncbi:family 78 glycoside hydrolase catalytic domain [Dysgonomonas termitidis]|uniref:alpha-L-rhamnosidase n=1 Tax=Dysgonomonas termitidis TaxID=1516126 RepID=A0ABV9L040_9BACT
MKMYRYMGLITVFLFTVCQIYAREKEPAKCPVYPTDLKCEYLKNPIGLDVFTPRLSWKLTTRNIEARGQKQHSFQIIVATSEAVLQQGKADLWDSGTVKSDESVNIIYNGKKLNEGQQCFWTVRVCDEHNHWSAWSEPSFWTMGITQNSWKGKWIGANGLDLDKQNEGSISMRRADPWIRKNLELAEKPEKAVIYVASVGYHELYVNGKKIGDKVLMPSVSDHKRRARYITYDIAKELEKGDNVIALWLGTSWSIFPAYQTDDKPNAPLTLVQAEITFQDNRPMQIVSDESWKTHPSPNTLLGYWEAHHFAGEEYDSSKEIDGWNKPGYDDSDWKPASVFSPNLLVSADKTEPNRLIKEIRPVAIEEIEAGIYRIDMGVNFVGWLEMTVTGSPGDMVTFHFSEREKESSSYGLHSIYKVGESGIGVFCNKFNYMSGRWIKVSGIKHKPRLEDIKGFLIRPDFERIGQFKCDQPLMNDIYDATLWSFENLSLGNYVVDCPHRERRGYGGDALATTRPAMGNYSLGAFYTKWMEDWRDVQQADGNVPYTAPTHVGGGGPSWSGYCITLPWNMYRQYGDKRVLEESFPTIERWLAFVETKSAGNMLVRWGGKWSFLGDWLWPQAWDERSRMETQGKALGDTDETLFFNNCHWVYSLDLAANIAEIIGNGVKARTYRTRADEVRKTLHQKFFNVSDNSYVNGYPAYLAMALNTNIPPVELKDKVWKRLEHEIMVTREGHFWGGITAGSFLFFTLMDNEKNDWLYTMIGKEDFPGWGNMLKHNLGTFFEDWECRGSAIHSSYLYVGSWFIENLGGIKQPRAGFKQFTIDPWINQTHAPQEVAASYNSLYGDVVSNWHKKDGKLQMEVTIPPNTTALLYLRGVDANSVKENNQPLKGTKGIAIDVQKNEYTSLRLMAGRYKFSARMAGE